MNVPTRVKSDSRCSVRIFSRCICLSRVSNLIAWIYIGLSNLFYWCFFRAFNLNRLHLINFYHSSFPRSIANHSSQLNLEWQMRRFLSVVLSACAFNHIIQHFCLWVNHSNTKSVINKYIALRIYRY